MLRQLATVLLAAAILLPRSSAQQLRGPAISIPAPASSSASFGPGGRVGIALGGRGAMRHFHRPSSLLTAPYFYADYPSPEDSAETGGVAPPQVVFVQAPPAASPAPAGPKPGALLIEWQGDRYVRMGSTDSTPEAATLAPADTRAAKGSSSIAATGKMAVPAALTPVLLVYRDGHQEAIREYIIADGTIYARGDYWTDGYWNKKIPLTALDVPASVKASEAHGAKLLLPASANEIIMRP